MTNGVHVTLDELIALRRYAERSQYSSCSKASRTGSQVTKWRGRGMDFTEVRNYQAGDDIRHMEWRVTARTGRPHIKLYQEERERPVIIVTDFSSSMYFGTRIAFKSVVAARLAALLAWTAVAQGDRVGALLFSAQQHNEFIPRGRQRGVLPLLGALSHYTQDVHAQMSQAVPHPSSLGFALQRVRRVAKPGSILILISDFYRLDAEGERHLSRLREHNDILAYTICDPLEMAPPEPERYAIGDGQHEVLFDMREQKQRQIYAQYCQERLQGLQKQFQGRQIPSFEVTAETDLSLMVRQSFPRRAHA